MLDLTIGIVERVIDGNTFTMKLTHIGTHNINAYNNYETVRIADRKAANLFTAEGLLQKNRLEREIGGKSIRSHIRYRDEYGILIADIENA